MVGLRRRLLSVLVALVSIVGVSLPAQAAEDLSSYFTRAAAAEFSGDQVVTCTTPVGIRDSAARVAQKAGVMYVSAGVEGAPAISASAGTLAVTGPGGTARTVQVAAATKPPTSYQLGTIEQVTYLERPADRLTLTTGGRARVRLTFDDATGAILRSETLNADGTVYCTTKMTTFVPGTPRVPAAGAGQVRTLEKATEFPSEVFPDRIASFRRLDVYGWNTDGEMAYYSDGFFAFALYHVPGRFSVDEVADAKEWTGKLGEYWRWYRPGTVTFVWDTDEGGMALYGDIPVDLQPTVLTELPPPARPSFFDRILSLFS
jgi:hypothetical protein